MGDGAREAGLLPSRGVEGEQGAAGLGVVAARVVGDGGAVDIGVEEALLGTCVVEVRGEGVGVGVEEVAGVGEELIESVAAGCGGVGGRVA
ncbi:hypothetical protein [Streptomyces sp. NBC_01294]|uniref:hypothetical protein n=1 Tax=Streptomyces sp. NBC_01294 TaxID=2903815 RepID=UPI002DD7A738|nr:hypothetical protein [Streptomyces sp. NBC_01294]WRZ55091.1 hypothetical protein OG534_00235 [Streptomyces sp. NBC_01294]